MFEKMNHELIELIRKKSKPSVAIIDSQSVKKTEVCGIDGYDLVKKRRHILVDNNGFVLIFIHWPRS